MQLHCTHRTMNYLDMIITYVHTAKLKHYIYYNKYNYACHSAYYGDRRPKCRKCISPLIVNIRWVPTVDTYMLQRI